MQSHSLLQHMSACNRQTRSTAKQEISKIGDQLLGKCRPRLNLLAVNRRTAARLTQNHNPTKICAIAADRDTIDDITQHRYGRLLEQFAAADTNGDGVLQRDELRSLLEKVGDGNEAVPMSWLTEEDISAVFDRYDTDQNGVISFEEFENMAKDNIFLSGALADYKTAFDLFDTSKTGKLGPTEIYRMFEKLEMGKNDPKLYEKIVSVFKHYDLDENGEIDLGEFLRMFRNQLIDIKEILTFISTPEHALETTVELDVSRSDSMSPGEVTTFFTDKEFRQLVKDNSNRTTVIMASLTWCKPCKRINPEFKRMAGSYSNVAFVKFFGNSNEETKVIFKEILKCRVTPSFYFYRNGQLLGSCTGANSQRVEDNLRRYMKDDELPSRMYSSGDDTE